MATFGEGIYLDLEDGQRLIDAVGGASVACLGTSHPKVIQAIKDQVDRVPCMCYLKPIRAVYGLFKCRCVQHATFE